MPSFSPTPSIRTNFTFTLESFQIFETRSKHKDTDFVTFTLLIKPQTGSASSRSLNRSMGDLNNGTYPVNLSFPDVGLLPTDTVVVNYIIINCGNKDAAHVTRNLQATASSLSQTLTNVSDLLHGHPIEALGGTAKLVVQWISDGLAGLFSEPDCDGTVAVKQTVITGTDLAALTSHAPFQESATHPGSESPHGCGSNSLYVVNWSMERSPTTPFVNTVSQRL